MLKRLEIYSRMQISLIHKLSSYKSYKFLLQNCFVHTFFKKCTKTYNRNQIFLWFTFYLFYLIKNVVCLPFFVCKQTKSNLTHFCSKNTQKLFKIKKTIFLVFTFLFANNNPNFVIKNFVNFTVRI